jgi:hypothetical protein
VWQCTPVIPTLGRRRQEDCEFEGSLGNIARPISKTNKQTKRNRHNYIFCLIHYIKNNVSACNQYRNC